MPAKFHVKFTGPTEVPPHTFIGATASVAGLGLTVTTTVKGVPAHPFATGVTV